MTSNAMWFRHVLQIIAALARRTFLACSLTGALRTLLLAVARCKSATASVFALCAWTVRERGNDLSHCLSGLQDEGETSMSSSDPSQVAFADCFYCGTTHIALEHGNSEAMTGGWLCMRCGYWNQDARGDVLATLPSHLELFGAEPVNDSVFDISAILQHEADLIFAQNFSSIAD